MGKNTEAKSDPPVGIEYFPECELCPKLCNNSVSVCMEGDGPSNADFMIVGGYPQEDDDELNRPFVGPHGSYVRDELLVAAGIPESKVRFTYAARCTTPKGRTPTILEVRKCRRYLTEEIKRVKPKVIVGMGNVAMGSLMEFYYKGAVEEGTSKSGSAKLSGISKWQGRLVWLPEFQCWFMPTYDAAYCIANEMKRSIYTAELVAQDLANAWDAMEKKPPAKIPKSIYVTDPDLAARVIKKMWNAGVFAYDIETGGKGKTTNKRIIGASFACDEDIGYYIPWRIFQKRKSLLLAYYTLIGSKKHTKIMHNGAYETRIHRMSQTKTPWWDKYYDTMIAAHLVDENFSKRLKDLAWLYTPIGGYDVELEKYKFEHTRENPDIKEDYSLFPEEMLGKYGGYDAVSTFILYNRLNEGMAREKVRPVFDKIAMPNRRVLSDAEVTGFYMDLEQAHKLNTACKKAKLYLEEQIYEIAGRKFNIASGPQLQEILFKEMKFRPLKKTKTGFSVDAESIHNVSTQAGGEIAKLLLDRQYVKTMQGTHIRQAIEFCWEEDQRVHTNYNSTGAVTGRISASYPSLQNVPADRLIRSLYTATPGNILIEADLKSAELAAIAAVSGEQLFIDSFEQGFDPHAATYRRLYDLPESYTPTSLERRQAKAVNFGMVYGKTAVGFAADWNVTVEEAQAFIDLYFKQLPNIAAWMEEQREFVRKHGYVVSVFGRKRRLPLGLSDRYGDYTRAERQAMNSPIQSSAADYTYIGLNRLRRALKRSDLETRIVHTVHDCVITDGSPFEEEQMTALLRESFEKPVKALPVGMRIDIEVGTKWGQHNESRLSEILESTGFGIAA